MDDLERKKKHEREKKSHEFKTAELDRRIQVARLLRDAQIAAEREQARLQKEEDLQKVQELATKAPQMRSSSVDSWSFLPMVLLPSSLTQHPADSSSQPSQSPTSPNNVIHKDRCNPGRGPGDLGCDLGVLGHFCPSLHEAERKQEGIECLAREEQAALERHKAEREAEEEIALMKCDLEEQARSVKEVRCEAERMRQIRQKEVERLRELDSFRSNGTSGSSMIGWDAGVLAVRTGFLMH
ncbi:hypothetical protein M378DRAFT_596199 [Amanita muscaria Koide BX008]|uniref:Uncharacterized protein n=1 Tax=Amanita muscaria (strain Koide BX008) TaxID=946122 RepID=A0A0C2WRT9_AMAMK|nr:hypothetical protein M378DRAFT_596199 [Amanita muscaria Koide BX008]